MTTLRRTSAVLAAALAVTISTSAPRAAESVRLQIKAVGHATVDANLPDADTVTRYFVDWKERVTGTLTGAIPAAARVYPLTRSEGEATWTVQPQTNSSARQSSPAWTGEVRFGDQKDTGRRFELMSVLFREAPLPGPIPPGVLARSAIAYSPIVKVERQSLHPFVGIASIRDVEIFGNEEPEVYLQAPIEIISRDLPPGVLIGVVIHPVQPGTDRQWAMVDRFGGSHGVIVAQFGDPGMHNFSRFRVTAFATKLEDFPPVGVALTPDVWERYSARFVATSIGVTVTRWEGLFAITSVAGQPVVPRLTIAAGPQADVAGTIDHHLGERERIWLIAVPPAASNPWVAGWTSRLRPSGTWTVNVARLTNGGRVVPFELVAVVSGDDPTAIAPEKLRAWVYDQKERPARSVPVRVSSVQR